MSGTLASSGTPSYNVADQARMAAAVNYFAWQARLVKPQLGQRVVEVGCGTGNFTRQLLDREAVLTLDSDADCIAENSRRFRDRGNVRAGICDASELSTFDEARNFRADSVVCLNVLEHIEDDRRALGGMASLLPARGVIVLIVPAFRALYGPIDRNLGHYRRYDRRSITTLARDCDLKIATIRYMNFVGFFGWWLNARILKRETQSESQIWFFDRWVVPALSRLEAALPPPFGQSLFVVLRKP
jgi:ubiquinone/menaquinone biosynthesis C-methylase UbiE